VVFPDPGKPPTTCRMAFFMHNIVRASGRKTEVSAWVLHTCLMFSSSSTVLLSFENTVEDAFFSNQHPNASDQ
jgi:hypothetical protein